MAWSHKIKRRPADVLFSKYIKQRDKGLCQYNFVCFRGMEGTDNSHFQKRSHESTRFDPSNCDLACRPCHNFVENDPTGQRTLEAWKLKQLGGKEYYNLLVRANSYKKKDDFISMIGIKALIKQLKP